MKYINKLKLKLKNKPLPNILVGAVSLVNEKLNPKKLYEENIKKHYIERPFFIKSKSLI